jgi:DNA repair exonuclease SbcCD ATPase subunit
MQDHENDPLMPVDSSESELEHKSNEDITNTDIEAESIPDEGEPTLPNEDVEEPGKVESRTRQVFRKFIRWAVGLLIIFGLGFLTAVFSIYDNKVDELDQSLKDLNNAGTTIAELEAQIKTQQNEIDDLNSQIDTLNSKIIMLEEENQNLTESLDSLKLQIALPKTRADLVSAQVSLYEGKPAQARVLLESANQGLIVIKSLLPEDLKDVVPPLQSRLELAIGGMNDDPETAIADLGILASDLLEIENALFRE